MKKPAIKLPKIPLPLDKVTAFLNGRTMREKHMFIGFFAVFVLAIDYLVLVQPVMGAYGSLLPKMSEFQKKHAELVDDSRNAAEIKKKFQQAKQLLDEQEAMAVTPAAAAALLESLSKEARETGVKITSVKPAEAPRAKAGQLFTALPIKISAIAGTHELGRFLSRLESGKTFFRVANLSITSTPLSERRHTVELTLEACQKVESVAERGAAK